MLRPVDSALSEAPVQPSITLAATITATAASEVVLAIRIEPIAAIPGNSYLKIRGLPPMVALSEGHFIGPGSWAVPLRALPNLKIIIPAGAQGSSEFVVTLVALDGAELDEKKSRLIVRDGSTPGLPKAPALTAAPLVKVPALNPEDRQRALKLTREGDRHMAQGNIAAARQVYELAAEAGLAQAAMALAATYDAAELARFNVRGIEPNAKEAQRWYERARRLGAAEAEQRLLRLGARPGN